MNFNKKAQHLLEALLVVAATTSITLLLANPQGPVRSTVEEALKSAVSSIGSSYQWQTVPTTSCTQACGGGTFQRDVFCQQDGTTRVADEFCSGAGPKPGTTGVCNVEPCPSTYEWQAVATTSCTRVCGGGTLQRDVFCQQDGTTRVADEFCSGAGAKPSTSEACNVASCVWRISQLGLCSVPCGDGTQSVSWQCYLPDLTTIVNESDCFDSVRPPVTQSCNLGSCYQWRTSVGTCSNPCGVGTAPQTSACIHVITSTVVADNLCDASARPAATVSCDTTASCAEYSWSDLGAPFGNCSELCGDTGVQTKDVFCIRNSTGAIVQESFCQPPKPVISQECNRRACYSWRDLGMLDPCSEPVCGLGTRTSTVVCENVAAIPVADAFCDPLTRPTPVTESCQVATCAYDWQIGDFGQCDQACGDGTRTRDTTCVRQNDSTVVDDSFCDPLTRPLVTEPCNLGPCPPVDYRWAYVALTPCNTTCGIGTQTVLIGCQHIATATTVDDSFCAGLTRIPEQAPLECLNTADCCGNSVCDTLPPFQGFTYQETINNCEIDCAVCGDTVCSAVVGEDCNSCSIDCNQQTSAIPLFCGDERYGCAFNERSYEVSYSCPGNPAVECRADAACIYSCTGTRVQGSTTCPNTTTGLWQNFAWSYVAQLNNCRTDTKCQAVCPSPLVPNQAGTDCVNSCGNSQCDNGETAQSCPQDCGVVSGWSCGQCPYGYSFVGSWDDPLIAGSTAYFYACNLNGGYGTQPWSGLLEQASPTATAYDCVRRFQSSNFLNAFRPFHLGSIYYEGYGAICHVKVGSSGPASSSDLASGAGGGQRWIISAATPSQTCGVVPTSPGWEGYAADLCDCVQR